MSFGIATSGYIGDGFCIATGGFSCTKDEFNDLRIELQPTVSMFVQEHPDGSGTVFDYDSATDFAMEEQFTVFEYGETQTVFKFYRRLLPS